LSIRKAFMLGMAFVIILLASTGCISITIHAPTPMVTPSPTPTPTSPPEERIEIREKDELLNADPALFQFSVTLMGEAIDAKTGEEVSSAQVTLITPTGTYRFESRYELTIPSGSIVRMIIEAPGYETIDVQIKPHCTTNMVIEGDMPLEPLPKPEI